MLRLYEEENVKAIADAIRNKNGSSDTYTVGDMASAISEISGSAANNLIISITETSAQAAGPTTGNDGYLGVTNMTYSEAASIVEEGLELNTIVIYEDLDNSSRQRCQYNNGILKYVHEAGFEITANLPLINFSIVWYLNSIVVEELAANDTIVSAKINDEGHLIINETIDAGQAKGDTGAQGPAGTTPVKGVDYWTAADKAEIVADVLAAGANIPDYVRTTAAAVAEKVLGVTGEATAAVSTGVSYTNRLPLSIDSSGAVYNTTGYKTGYRLNSSGAEKQITESYYDSSVCVTGFIPCTAGDVIRLAGLVIDPADTQAGAYNLAVYDSSFAKVDVASWKDVLTHASATTDSDGHISAITLSGKFGTAAVAYIRLSAKGVTADSIVTVNEEIGGGGTVTVDASRVPFNLAFLTDLHWNDDDAGRLEHAAGALSVIHETAPLDAVVFGGDYIRNWSAVTAAEAREDISMCRECFAAAVDAPALWLRGNHDNNPYPGARLSKPEIFNRISRAQNTLRGFVSNPHDPYGCYGYMDFENARMRLVIVNTSDNDAFGMASLSGSYSALLDAYSISAAQLQWVADHALDFSDKASPEDWGLVFLSHAPIYSADSWSNTHTYTDSDGVAWTCNVVNLANLVKAYADKSSFSASLNGEIVSKDFSGLSSTAKVLCFVNGHEHALLSSSYNGFTFISCPNACNAGEKASADGTTYSKSAAGTAGETAFTALTIDPANSKVYAWVYGSGYDRTLTL